MRKHVNDHISPLDQPFARCRFDRNVYLDIDPLPVWKSDLAPSIRARIRRFGKRGDTFNKSPASHGVLS